MKRGHVRTAGTVYSSSQFENAGAEGRKGNSRLPAVMDDIRSSFMCKSAALLLLEETELVLVALSGSEGPNSNEKRIRLDSGHPLAKAAVSGSDSLQEPKQLHHYPSPLERRRTRATCWTFRMPLSPGCRPPR